MLVTGPVVSCFTNRRAGLPAQAQAQAQAALTVLTVLHRCPGGPYTSRPALPSRYLATLPHGALGPGAREIGRKNRKGKNSWRVKTTSQGHGCKCASASPASPRLFLSSLPSPPLPQPKQGPRRSPTALCRAANCSLRGCFPYHFLFHLVFILPCPPPRGTAQPLPR